MHRALGLVLANFSLLCTVMGQVGILDSCDDPTMWRAMPSDGVRMNIRTAPGVQGKALAVDFEFLAGSGYAIAQRDLPLDLPTNYRFTFYLKGETPQNNFEFKLLDSLGNVYWIKRMNIDYPPSWKKQSIKKRHLSYAWGPSGPGVLRKASKVEFVVSAGTGGKGTFYVDELAFERLPDSSFAAERPRVSASSAETFAGKAVDGDAATAWRSANTRTTSITMEYTHTREIGGLVVRWEKGSHATKYSVALSDNGRSWDTVYTVEKGNGGTNYLNLGEAESRFIRLIMMRGTGRHYGICEVTVKGPEFSTDGNAFFSAIAADNREGLYPRYLLKQQSYWTIVGSGGDMKEALINTDGQVEVDKGSFSLEPFVYLDGHLTTWKDVTTEQTLDRGYLPVPSTAWRAPDFRLRVRAFAAGEAGRSVLVVSYTVVNRRPNALCGKLFVAVRPFQVNPPWQFLNLSGGTAKVRSITGDGRQAIVNETRRVVPLVHPSAFGAATFDEGDITEYLAEGILPALGAVRDPLEAASGAFSYDIDIDPGDSVVYHVAIPFYQDDGGLTAGMGRAAGDAAVAALLRSTREYWQSRVDSLQISLPPSADAVIRTVKSNLAYILINRDGPAIQPGSRSYERAWIRDGSLTSTALLQTGNTREVREYLDWYAPHQYPSGKIPCVVDFRGADPVAENDSHGEFIYAVRQYFLYTHDTTWLRGKYDHVVRAVRYVRELRGERMTDRYRHGTPTERACFGLVPESISHEGYSANPMHSYWDDFFVLRGFKDATAIAAVLGEDVAAREFAAVRDSFRTDLYASMNLAMHTTGVDYVPGCVELGDFDATSTAIGITPCGELGYAPEPAMTNTFERYYRFFVNRRDGQLAWRDYTPYEVRLIGALVQLGWRPRAYELLQFFLDDRRPPGWNHWAEVVWRDPATPRFIGDMPHTWVGSDFIRSVRSMFVYEREKDSSLVLAAGVPEAWVMDPAGVCVTALPTVYGHLSYAMKPSGNDVTVSIRPLDVVPHGGIRLLSPRDQRPASVLVNGRQTECSGELVLHQLPAEVLWTY